MSPSSPAYRHVLLAIILGAGDLTATLLVNFVLAVTLSCTTSRYLSVTLRAALTTSPSSPAYRHVLFAIVLAAGDLTPPSSLTSYSSRLTRHVLVTLYCITSRCLSVTLRAALTMSLSSPAYRHVLFAIVLAAGDLTPPSSLTSYSSRLTRHVLVTLYCITSHCLSVLTTSLSSPEYHHVLFAIVLATADLMPPSSSSYSSRLTRHIPSVDSFSCAANIKNRIYRR